jgi:hypothetical protein
VELDIRNQATISKEAATIPTQGGPQQNQCHSSLPEICKFFVLFSFFLGSSVALCSNLVTSIEGPLTGSDWVVEIYFLADPLSVLFLGCPCCSHYCFARLHTHTHPKMKALGHSTAATAKAKSSHECIILRTDALEWNNKPLRLHPVKRSRFADQSQGRI